MVTGDEWASSTIQWSNKPAAETQLEANISHNNKTKYQFSCLTAVQHWYDGDPTGQNQNYGVMIRYYDETIADYNSFYSADHTDETLRPVLAISYQPQLDEIDIPEGLTYPLSISGATGTVTWTSSNPGAATVDANGNVTGIKAGCTMITAYVDGLEQKSYVVYVTLQEGVYYIRQGESLCIGTNGCVAENTAVTMQGISGTTEFNQLWRIKYLSNGYYSIRPMYKLNMALHCTDSAVDIVSTGTTDSLENVTYWSRWTITYDSSGYLIQCWGRADKTMYSSNPYPSASVAVGEYASSNSSFKWDFERVTSITNQVLLLNDPSGTSAVNAVRYAAPGETLTLDDLGITASFVCSFDIDQSITWGTLNEDAVYVDPDTGAVTALVPDRTATITATHTLNGLNYQKQYTVRIVAVPSGVFFIRNPQSEKYVQIRFDTAANSYMTSGAYMEQRTCCGSDYQKWAITLLNDGYYSIISVQSGLALSVVSNQTASADVTLIQEAYSGADRQKWAISVTDAGYYKIKAKSSETANEDLTMAVDGSNVNSLDGIVIQQDTYVNDTTYLDEWQLCSMIDIGMSTDDYNTSPSDSHRACYRHATTFYDGLLNIAGGVPTTKTHHYNMDSTQTAFVDDFAQYGAISDEIDFMVYIGHGHAADSHTENGALGNHLHYNCGIIDDPHVYVDNTEMYTHCNPASNVYTDGMEFGSSTSDLRWVWLYTCHFLAENEYVSNDDLKGMMNGAHIVMGYATQSYLCDPNALKFGQYLRSGETIIRSFFKAGNEGEGIGKANGGTDDHHIQKVLFIPQAEYETIYSPQIKYEYDPSDVKIITNDIQVPYD